MTDVTRIRSPRTGHKISDAYVGRQKFEIGKQGQGLHHPSSIFTLAYQPAAEPAYSTRIGKLGELIFVTWLPVQDVIFVTRYVCNARIRRRFLLGIRSCLIFGTLLLCHVHNAVCCRAPVVASIAFIQTPTQVLVLQSYTRPYTNRAPIATHTATMP